MGASPPPNFERIKMPITKREEYMVRMLETLQDLRDGQWANLKTILLKCGMSKTLGAARLADLHDMYQLGVLDRKTVKGQFYYQLLTSNWNRDRPFTSVLGFDPREPQPTPVPVEKTGGDAITVALDSAALDALTEIVKKLQNRHHQTQQELDELKDRYARSSGAIEVKHWDGEVIKLKGVTLPAIFQDVMDLATCRENILLVGPAGCGKTHIAEMIAKSLKLEFGSLSCTSGMSETHLLGRSTPDFHEGKSKFQGTEFLRVYEGGGVFLMDEIDAADSNLLLALNSALANGYANVPNRPNKPRAVKHDDFVMIATANTYGRGATRVYAGRNQLDEATIDRFRIGTVECDYDRLVEEALCPDDELRKHFWAIRDKIEAAGIRRILSTRFLIQAYKMANAPDVEWSLEKIVKVFFNGWSLDEKNKVHVPLPTKKTKPDAEDAEPHDQEDSANPSVSTDVEADGKGGWKCRKHGAMIRMASDKGWKCIQAGKFDMRTKQWSGCNCCVWDSRKDGK